MKVITLQEGLAILDPHLGVIRDCFMDAWQAWEKLGELDPALRFPLGARSRAAFVNEQLCHLVKHRFEGASNIRPDDSSGFLVLNIADKVLLRFKKLNDNLHSNNIPTQQQLRFSWQMELPGMPPAATRLVVGYRLNKLQTAIRDIIVTCPLGKRIVWYFPIAETEPKILLHPAMMSEATRKRPRVTAKDPKKPAKTPSEK